jgi:signal transduction histidine kinase
MFRTLRPGQLVFDIVAPGVLLLLLFFPYVGREGFPGVVLLFGMCLALAFRRLSPELALGLAWAAAIVQMLSGIAPDPADLAILPVLYTTAAYGRSVVKWAGLASAIVGPFVIAAYLVLIPAAVEPTLYTGTAMGTIPYVVWFSSFVYFGFLALFALSWTLGLLSKTWRNARESRRAQALAEQRRIAVEGDVAIEQERNRIARDMHDVVAHSLAVVIAQADGARYARKTDPAAVDEALSTISSTAREALGDVRLLLGQLRHSQGDGPQPVLADLDRLIDQMRAAGLTVSFVQEGIPIALGTGRQLAVYRIVQEALTNALRHGDTAQDVEVGFVWMAGTLGVTVSSALPAGAPTTEAAADGRAGHGLAGMRERAVLVGGTFAAGVADGRYVVAANLPTVAAEVTA